MQIVTYKHEGVEKIGYMVGTSIYELRMVNPGFPTSAVELKRKWMRNEVLFRQTFAALADGNIKYPLHPTEIRDVWNLETLELSPL